MRNVEAKFKLANRERTLKQALAVGFTKRAELSQRDTFFVTASGKLKLREEAGGAQLIFYRRRDLEALQLSDYEIVPVAEPLRMRSIMASAFGVLAEVIKRRVLLMRDNVRLHLDSVEGLGEFGEIEAVLIEGESETANRDRVARLLEDLEIRDADLIDVSYFELMTRR
jgi:predicted adenylyl cyclase CyaB